MATMRVVRGLEALPGATRGGAIAIGNFDGVHLGHQAILRQLKDIAARGEATPERADTLVTFDPLPAEVLAPERAPPRLSSEQEKLHWLSHYGLAQCVLLPFSHEFSRLSPDTFVSQILADGLGARDVLVGRDFRYGARRAGDLTSLREAGQRYGFAVHVIDDVLDTPAEAGGGARISSTRVRQALSTGDCDSACALLGRPYSMQGVVTRGQALARTLGMRTANIHVTRHLALQYGVYAVRAQLEDGRSLPGVANIGVRPSVTHDGCWLEVHLFDFDEPLYGQHLAIEFLQFVRPEVKFGHVDALKAQMHRDAEAARAVFADH